MKKKTTKKKTVAKNLKGTIAEIERMLDVFLKRLSTDRDEAVNHFYALALGLYRGYFEHNPPPNFGIRRSHR
jgi:hypothetical protein